MRLPWVSRTDERGFTTSLTFDNLNRLNMVTLPDDDQDPENNPQQTLAFNVLLQKSLRL